MWVSLERFLHFHSAKCFYLSGLARSRTVFLQGESWDELIFSHLSRYISSGNRTSDEVPSCKYEARLAFISLRYLEHGLSTRLAKVGYTGTRNICHAIRLHNIGDRSSQTKELRFVSSTKAMSRDFRRSWSRSIHAVLCRLSLVILRSHFTVMRCC